MRQMKSTILAVLMTMTFGVSITSCMDEENSTLGSVMYEYVRVNDEFPITFTNRNGVKLTPTTSIIGETKDMAVISYYYDMSKVTETTTEVPIIFGTGNSPYYFDISQIEKSASEEEDTPIITLEPDLGIADYYSYPLYGSLFDSNTLVLPVAYKSKTYTDEDDYNAEKALHTFSLICNPETDFDGTTLTLHLQHYLATNGEEVDRTDNYIEFKAYDLSSILNQISGTPTKIRVLTNEYMDSNNSGSTTTKENTYEYDYNFNGINW